jgi:hypothetical protein
MIKDTAIAIYSQIENKQKSPENKFRGFQMFSGKKPGC